MKSTMSAPNIKCLPVCPCLQNFIHVVEKPKLTLIRGEFNNNGPHRTPWMARKNTSFNANHYERTWSTYTFANLTVYENHLG